MHTFGPDERNGDERRRICAQPDTTDHISLSLPNCFSLGAISVIKPQHNKEDSAHEFCITFGNCAHDKATPPAPMVWIISL